jgi:hypothetical protein
MHRRRNQINIKKLAAIVRLDPAFDYSTFHVVSARDVQVILADSAAVFAGIARGAVVNFRFCEFPTL